MIQKIARELPVGATASVSYGKCDVPTMNTSIGSEKIVFMRDKGVVHALRDRCPHRGVPLSLGTRQFPGTISCPYHGWTYGTDAVSTSIADNPNALATRPDWVHTVESPNSFRGKYRGADVDRYAVEAVRQIEALIADGRAPAAFISETVYGNAGGMALPVSDNGFGDSTSRTWYPTSYRSRSPPVTATPLAR